MTGIYDSTIATMGSFAPTVGLTFADALKWDEVTATSWTFLGPYVWDVTVDSSLIVSAAVGGDPGWPWLSIWDIDSLSVGGSGWPQHSAALLWSSLQARGLTPGTQTLYYTVGDPCDETVAGDANPTELSLTDSILSDICVVQCCLGPNHSI